MELEVSEHLYENYKFCVQFWNISGTASARKESSRYYTSGGTVIRFMQNGTIQILTARGVTTNIREISTKCVTIMIMLFVILSLVLSK